MTNPSIGRVRGKFVVNSIVRHRGSKPGPDGGGWVPCELHTVHMTPVMGGSPEDNSYAQASPSGKIELSISKPETVGFFDLDQKFYVDFTPAE